MQAGGVVSARVPFDGGTAFDYRLESSADAARPAARFSGSELTVTLPEADVRAWAETDRVSIAAEQALADGQVLKILVEKDFACLTPREGEDESDMFPHPLEGRETC